MQSLILVLTSILALWAAPGQAMEPPDRIAAEKYLAGDWFQRSSYWNEYAGAEIVARGRIEKIEVVNAGGVPKVLIVALDVRTVGIMDIRYFLLTSNFNFRDFLKTDDVFVFRGLVRSINPLNTGWGAVVFNIQLRDGQVEKSLDSQSDVEN